MVLPAPAAHVVATDADAWLGKLKRALERSRGGMVVLLRSATLPWIGPVVRALSPEPPWAEDGERVLQVCLTAPELAAVPVGSRVLLRVRAQDVDWLNLYRPIVADRELRLILWADAEATDALLRGALDFASWIVRVVEVPAANLPEFAVERMREALASGREIAWRGPMLAETLAAAGWSAEIVECSASLGYIDLFTALGQPGLPVVSGVVGERGVWRVRFALAQNCRPVTWVAADPVNPNVGLLELSVRQLDWDRATQSLAAVGQRSPALLAAWRNLDPVAMLDGAEAPQQDATAAEWRLVEQLRELGETTPEAGLVQNFVDGGFVEVAMQLELVRWQHGETGDSRRLISWLSERGRSGTALDVASQWAERARRENDPRSLAAAYAELGSLDAKLGKIDDARRHHQNAITILKEMIEREPDRSDLRLQLSGVYNLLGILYSALGQYADARHHHEAAIAISFETLLRDTKPSSDQLRHVSFFCELLGNLDLRLGQHDTARSYFEVALDIRKRLVEYEPEHSDLRSDLSKSYVNFGILNVELGNPDDARRYFQDALAVCKDQVEREPERTDLRRNLSDCYDRLGALESSLRNFEDARRYFEEALFIREDLAECEPDRGDLRLDVSVSCSRLGKVLVALGQAEDARGYFEHALTVRERLVEHDPERSDLRRELSFAYEDLGELNLALGRSEGARPYFERTLAIRKDLVDRTPERSTLQRSLSAAYVNLAVTETEPTQARELLERAIAISRDDVSRDPANAVSLRLLAQQLAFLAEVLAAASEHDEARRSAREALDLLESLDSRGALDAPNKLLLGRLAERFTENAG